MTTAPRGSALSVLSGHTLVYLSGTLAARVASIMLLPLFTPLLTRAEVGLIALTDTTIALLLQLVGFQLDAALSRRYLGAADAGGRARVDLEYHQDAGTIAHYDVQKMLCGVLERAQ